ncbi:MAG: PAS domain S-box protein [Proteobacteria bacterium]|nr:PAS domain S-box protein [Desulfobacula sp.]MBU4131267.1 PAS domain S-box protein [Pseudomonadota bacterium]
MIPSAIVGLFNNVVLLICLAYLYDQLTIRQVGDKSSFSQIFTGLILGVIGLAVMLNPWEFTHGVVFDTRSILLCITGFFFGAVPVLITILMTACYRIYLGGAGVWMGTAVIITSGLIGLAWRHRYKEKFEDISWKKIYLMGLIVHVLMLFWTILLPWPIAKNVLANIILPVLLFFPIGTALLGQLMINRHANKLDKKTLAESEERFKLAMSASRDGLWDWDITTDKGYYSPAYGEMLGYPSIEVPQDIDFWKELIHPNDREIALKANMGCIENECDDFNIEFRMKVKNGGWKWINSRGKVVDRDETGRATRIVGTHVDINDYKQSKNEIQKHAENLNAIFNSAPNVLALVNEEIRVEMINNKGAVLMGKTKEVIAGALCGDVFNCLKSFAAEGCGKNPECSQCPLRPMMLSTFQTGASLLEEGQMTFLINGNETSMDLLISTSLLDINGKKKVLLSLTDISERNDAIKALRESEEKFRLAFHTSPDSINLNRLEDGMYLEINKGFTKIMGYTREETIGKTSLELDIWKNTDDRKRLIEGLKEKGYVENLEAVFCGKEGRIRDGLMSARIMKMNDQNVIMSITRDNTERKRAEIELKRSEEQHRSILQTAMDGFWLTNNNGNILETNQTYSLMSGYSQDELLKMKIEDLEVIENKVDISKRIKKIAMIGDDRFETHHRRKNGSVFNVEVRIQYRDDNGGRYICFLRDITGQKQLETQIRQAQKMESIGNLAGGIAHDFNNILFPIIGYAEMLIDDLPLNSPERKNAQGIMTAGKRGGKLVSQILAFSRQDVHKLIPVMVQKVLKEVLKLSRSSIPTNVEINHHLQHDCGLVLADATQLHQIGMNLITNAYHAVEKNYGKIEVQVKEIFLEKDELPGTPLHAGKYVQLSVSDNGCGISPAVMDKIFEPYFTTKEKGKGTGLGLAVVYGIVKEHKGDIKVFSEVGKGTTIKVYLPVMAVSGATESSSEQMPVGRGTERILLVDDEVPITILMKQMLERFGYLVSIRTSSVDALEAFKAKSNAFDLVITDMSMPHMTGDQLANEILSVRPDIPIIICTGFSEGFNEETAKAMGIKGFLMKPVISFTLAQEVRRVLDEKKGRIGVEFRETLL